MMQLVVNEHVFSEADPRSATGKLDNLYYRDRAETERNIAARTADPKVAAVHAELAANYEALVAVLRGRPVLKLVSSN
jgi:hypothetical protein